MKQHPVAAIGNRHIVVVNPMWIDTHSRQCIVMLSQLVLQKIIIRQKTMLNRKQFFLFSQRKLQIVVRTIVGQNVSMHVIRDGINISFLVSSSLLKLKMLHKTVRDSMYNRKINRFPVQIDNRHLNFNTNIIFSFFLCGCNVFLIQLFPYKFSVHVVPLFSDCIFPAGDIPAYICCGASSSSISSTVSPGQTVPPFKTFVKTPSLGIMQSPTTL